MFDAWFANEADSRSRRHARRAARPVRDRVVLREDVVAANPAQARADKQAEVGHRLVSKTSCLALVAAVVTLLLIAVFALPGTWFARACCGRRVRCDARWQPADACVSIVQRRRQPRSCARRLHPCVTRSKCASRTCATMRAASRWSTSGAR